MVIVLQM